MNPEHETDKRLTDLECRQAEAEDLLDALNTTVYRQQREIERLQAQLLRLGEQLRDLSARGGPPLGPQDEIPPHY
ncbi:SlyX family protein [Pseudothauera nasutitermitis]|uniref:SlyX family protein n=1 Tax=Pseudothauera nasutitermitis TaxID=2565930 RepID=A0A4S4B2B1_9RHOO|nr:SlyX family protein [Pseudothauera nasutitermitis]THF66325.1 SlyX family protein [Pseudothauera nasutitermitis]